MYLGVVGLVQPAKIIAELYGYLRDQRYRNSCIYSAH